MALTLRLLPERLAVARLQPDSPVPEWCEGGGFRSVSWTAEETSIVCAEAGVPADVRAERGWRAFVVDGPLDFGQTGVLAGIARPLAAAGISIFAVSTFDTDYVLVRDASVDEAGRILADAPGIAVANPAALSWVQRWYEAQCDGDWEHDYGVSIGTIDNPGWWVKIDLTGTDLEGRPFAEVSRPEPDPDWLACGITEGRWEGAGAPHMLGEILALFVAWAREVDGAG